MMVVIILGRSRLWVIRKKGFIVNSIDGVYNDV